MADNPFDILNKPAAKPASSPFDILDKPKAPSFDAVDFVSTTKDAPHPELSDQQPGEPVEYLKRAYADPKYQVPEQRQSTIEYYRRQAQGEDKRIGDYVGTAAQSDTGLDRTTQFLESVRRGLITTPVTATMRTMADIPPYNISGAGEQIAKAANYIDDEVQSEYGVDPEADLNTLGYGTGAVIGSLPFGLARGAVSVGGMAAQQGVMGYDRARQSGAEAGSPGALATAGVSAAFGATQFPITRAIASRITPAGAGLVGQYAANVAGSSVEQLAGNVAQQGIENVIASQSYDPGRPLTADMRENVVSAIPGALVYGGYGTASFRAGARQKTINERVGEAGGYEMPLEAIRYSTPIERRAIKEMARSAGRSAVGFRGGKGAPGAFYDDNYVYVNVDDPGKAGAAMAVHEVITHIGGGKIKSDNQNPVLAAELDALMAARPGDVQAGSQLYLANAKAAALDNPSMRAVVEKLEANPVYLREEGLATIVEEAIYQNNEASQQIVDLAPNLFQKIVDTAIEMIPVTGKSHRVRRQAQEQLRVFTEVVQPMIDRATGAVKMRLNVQKNRNQELYSEANVEEGGATPLPGEMSGGTSPKRIGTFYGGAQPLDLGPYSLERPGGTRTVLNDPTSERQVLDLIGESEYGRIRGLLDSETGKTYFWDANNTTHYKMAKRLGLDPAKTRQFYYGTEGGVFFSDSPLGNKAENMPDILKALDKRAASLEGTYSPDRGRLLATRREDPELEVVQKRAEKNPGVGLFSRMFLDPELPKTSERNEKRFYTRINDWLDTNYANVEDLNSAADNAVADIHTLFSPAESAKYAEYYRGERYRERAALMKSKFPELAKTDEWQAYNAYWALGSNGTRLGDNIAEAIDVWTHLRDGGRFEPGEFKAEGEPVMFRGPYPGTKKMHYAALNRIMEVSGKKNAVRFLSDGFTMKELNKIRRYLGWTDGIETKRVKAIVKAATGQDELLPGSFIFGPKLGAYMQNAFGRNGYQTADLWEGLFYRMYNAKGKLELDEDGRPVKHPGDAEDNENMAAFGRIIQQALGTDTPAGAQAQRWFAIKKALKLLGYSKAGSLETSNEITQRIIGGTPKGVSRATTYPGSGRSRTGDGSGEGVRRGRVSDSGLGKDTGADIPFALKRGEAVLNIGHNIPEGGTITADDVRAALKRVGVNILSDTVHQSDTERTSVVRTNRALTPDEAEALSRELKQEAIAQYSDGVGELYGPKADAWRPFNPEYFLTEEGKRASESPLAVRREGDEPLREPGVKDDERDAFHRAFTDISPHHAFINARLDTLERRGEIAPASADILRGIFAQMSSPADFTPLKITARAAAREGGPFQLWVDYRNLSSSREEFGALNAQKGNNIWIPPRVAARTPENYASQRTPDQGERGGNDVAILMHEYGHGLLDIARAFSGQEVFPGLTGQELVNIIESNFQEVRSPKAATHWTGRVIHDPNDPAMKYMREAGAGADEGKNIQHWAGSVEEWFAQTFANWVLAKKVPDAQKLPKSPLRTILENTGKQLYTLIQKVKIAFGILDKATPMTIKDLEQALEAAFQGPNMNIWNPVTNVERVKRLQKGHEVLQAKWQKTESPLALFREGGPSKYLDVGHGRYTQSKKEEYNFVGGTRADLWAFYNGGLKKAPAKMEVAPKFNVSDDNMVYEQNTDDVLYANTHSEAFRDMKVGSPTGRIDHDQKTISVYAPPDLRPFDQLQYRMAVRQLAREHPDYAIKVFGEGPGVVRDASDGNFALRRGDATVGDNYELQGESIEDLIRRKVQDDFLTVRRTQEDVVSQGGRVLESSDPYLKQTLFKGRVKDKFDRIDHDVVEPIVKRMVAAKLTLPEVDDYLTALHAVERNAHIAKINPAMPDGGSGISNAEAYARLAKWVTDPRMADLKWIGAEVHRLNRRMLKQSVSMGLLSRDAAKAMAKTYRFYVPLKGEEIGDAEGTGEGYTARSSGLKRATGRGIGNEAESPLTHSVLQAHQLVVRAEKNRVARSLAKFVRDNPDDKLWKIDDVPVQMVVNPNTGLVEPRIDRRFQFADNVVPFMRQGKMHMIELKGEQGLRLANAFKRVGFEDGGRMIQGLGKVMRGYASLQTNLNPAFVVPNLVRDAATAGLRVGAERGWAEAGRVVAGIPKSVKTVWDVQGDPDSHRGSEFHDYFREYKANGGKVDSYAIGDFVKVGRSIERQLKDAQAKGVRRGLVAMRQAKDFIDRVNGSVETASRLSAYVQARKAGLSPERAAFWAKELTVNFNRKGEWGTAINSLWLFSNASLQGNVNTLRTVLRHRRGREIAAGIIATGAAMGLVMPMLFGEDEEGRKTWEEIPDSVKETNLIIPTGGGKYAKIPLPYGYNALYNVGRYAAEATAGTASPGKSATRLLASTVDTFNPLGHSGSPLQAAAPTLLDPGVQAAENKDWTGRAIVPQQSPFGPQKPDSQLATKTTSQFSRVVAELLNRVTGGDDVTEGKADVSPAMIDHWLGFATGGLGRFMSETAGLARRTATGDFEDFPANKWPLADRFVGQLPSPARLNRRDLYKLVDEHENDVSDMRHYIEQGDDSKANNMEAQKKAAFAYGEWAKDLKRRAANMDDWTPELEEEASKLLQWKNEGKTPPRKWLDAAKLAILESRRRRANALLKEIVAGDRSTEKRDRHRQIRLSEAEENERATLRRRLPSRVGEPETGEGGRRPVSRRDARDPKSP